MNQYTYHKIHLVSACCFVSKHAAFRNKTKNHDLIIRDRMSVSQITTGIFCLSYWHTPSFPHSWLFTGFVTRVTRTAYHYGAHGFVLLVLLLFLPFDHCFVSPMIYDFLLSLWYLQTFLIGSASGQVGWYVNLQTAVSVS